MASKFYIRKSDGGIMRETAPGRFERRGTVEEYLKLRKAQRRERARDERARIASGVVTQAETDRATKQFWDLIDASGGPAACHPWTGKMDWNHPEERGAERYQRGSFFFPGLKTRIVSRILCYLTYGREVPDHLDTTPTCGDHACCNMEHIVITPHGLARDNKMVRAVPAAQFFCEFRSAA